MKSKNIFKKIVCAISCAVLSAALTINASAYNGSFIDSETRKTTLPDTGYLAQASNELYTHEFTSASFIVSGYPTYCRVLTYSYCKKNGVIQKCYNFGSVTLQGGANQHISDKSYTFYGITSNHVFTSEGDNGTKFTLVSGKMKN